MGKPVGLALVLACLGCPSSPPSGMDLAGAGDLAAAPDLATAPPDLVMLAATGDPCARAADCAGTKAMCILKDASGLPWPGGYCTSTCNPAKNASDGTNAACPGGNGTCIGSGTSGYCETACTAMSQSNPCLRAGYVCFHSCRPAALSQCDPTVVMSCPQDGGALITVPVDGGGDGGGDGGTITYADGRTCARTGRDAVGTCTDACDPLYPQKAGAPSPPCKATQGCYPNVSTGEGTCFDTVGGGGDGAACTFLNNCDAGLACHSGVCRKLCGGPNAVGCPNGQTCKDLSSMVKASVLGICSP